MHLQVWIYGKYRKVFFLFHCWDSSHSSERLLHSFTIPKLAEEPQSALGSYSPSLGPICFSGCDSSFWKDQSDHRWQSGINCGQKALLSSTLPACWNNCGTSGEQQGLLPNKLWKLYITLNSDIANSLYTHHEKKRKHHQISPLEYELLTARQWFSEYGPRQAVLALPGNLLEMHISVPIQASWIGSSRLGPQVVLMHDKVWAPLVYTLSVPDRYVYMTYIFRRKGWWSKMWKYRIMNNNNCR